MANKLKSACLNYNNVYDAGDDILGYEMFYIFVVSLGDVIVQPFCFDFFTASETLLFKRFSKLIFIVPMDSLF